MDVAYIAGLFDGEGYFVTTISLKGRGKSQPSITVYQWAGISLAGKSAKKLLKEIVKWLEKNDISSDKIACRVFREPIYQSQKKRKQVMYNLRIANMVSLNNFCGLLNRKVKLKQTMLENFQLILRLRKERGRDLWLWDSQHHPKYKNLQETYEWFQMVALIWDFARYEKNGKWGHGGLNSQTFRNLKVQKGKWSSLEEKLEHIWRIKYPITTQSVDMMAPVLP